MIMRLADIKEQLELMELGDLPYRETNAEKIDMYRDQEAILFGIETAARDLRFRLQLTRIDLAKLEKEGE